MSELSTLAAAYADRIEHDLLANILPFWLDHVWDRDQDRFVTHLTNDLQPDTSVERGSLLMARILWTYATAYNLYRKDDYRALADRACRELLEVFADREHGGFIWSVTADGQPLQDRKQTYGQAFAVYALSAYHQATGLPEPLELARSTFRLIEEHCRDREFGGYLEALGREWQPIEDVRLSEVDMNAPKSQNTHLHLLEAYSALLQVWPDNQLRAAHRDLIDTMRQKILNPAVTSLGLFFTEDWKPLSEIISYGHNIEGAWLLTLAARVHEDPRLLSEINQLALALVDETLRSGTDSDGSLFYEGLPDGTKSDPRKDWWPQAEAVIGCIDAFEISGSEHYLQQAFRIWDFIQAHLIDHLHGEWFHTVDASGQPLGSHAKVSFWKCPYHNGRAAFEAVQRLRMGSDLPN